MNIDEILKSQRDFFASGATLSVNFRIEMLKKLYAAVKKYENEICRALSLDLGKSDFEALRMSCALLFNLRFPWCILPFSLLIAVADHIVTGNAIGDKKVQSVYARHRKRYQSGTCV